MSTVQINLEHAASEYSDFYKEAYGFRPRKDVSGWTVEDFQREFETLSLICEQNRISEKEAEKAAIADLNARISAVVSLGAKDRSTAIRWIADAEGAEGDMEYLCYKLGLPYGHFSQGI